MPISTQIPPTQHDAVMEMNVMLVHTHAHTQTHTHTQWLQPLDRGRQLAANLKQWKQEQERIVGEALLNKRPHPTLTPWVPPKPTLLQGIFFYQKTHMEELGFHRHRYHSIRGRRVEPVPS
jgi:hypothetical protein